MSEVVPSPGRETGGIDLSHVAERQFDAIREALAERRQELGISMSELARRVGVSPSMVSQIERGQTLPSVATLFALAAALGATVDAFFKTPPTEAAENDRTGTPAHADSPTPPPGPRAEPATSRPTDETDAQPRERLYVVREHGRAGVDICGGVRWERLTPGSLDDVEFLELIYQPHAESDPSLYRHPGVEMLVVLEGRFEIFIGFERYVLDAGDSALFSSSLPHRYVNSTDHVSRAVTAILRDGLGTAEGIEASRRALGDLSVPSSRKDVP